MILGRIFTLTWALVMIITFFTAYLSPEKAAIVTINDYGEANLELAMIFLGLPLMLWNFVLDLKICAAARSSRPACSIFRSKTLPTEGKHGKRTSL